MFSIPLFSVYYYYELGVTNTRNGRENEDEIMIAYECQSCGGRLVLDDNRKIYNCQSCGNTYDYTYFEGLELLENANNACERGEFQSAINMYDFLLRKEPDNFEALYGRVFAECKIKNELEFKADNLIKSHATLDFDFYHKTVTEEHKEFIDMLEDSMKLASDIYSRNVEINKTSGELKDYSRQIQAIEAKITEQYLPVKESKYEAPDYVDPHEYMRRSYIHCALVFGTILLCSVFTIPTDPTFVIYGSILGLVIAGIVLLVKWLVARNSLHNIKVYEKEITSVSSKKAVIQASVDKLNSDNARDRSAIGNNVRLMKKHIIESKKKQSK